uniref:DAGKc domain-containing protein n=1 Tax=Meloidogyne floridensis TaxID=298350 RepID=A0A915NZ06_9BILA
MSAENNVSESTPITQNNLNEQQNPSITIRDFDGKLHRIFLELNSLTIQLLNKKSQQTRFTATIPLESVLCIRSNRIRLRCGMPKKLPEIGADQPDLVNTSLYRPKHLLVFINPFGGKGKANGIWTDEVEPFFKLANITYELIKTERADHALETVRELDPVKWELLDGIVSVGGDGLFNEVLSSAIIRTQLQAGKNYNNEQIDMLTTPRVRFGIIGAGSANSIVSSVHGINDCPTAAIHIAIGSRCNIDVCAVYEDGNLLRFSADAISYGWLGDVLHDSERYRCLGPIRYQYSALRTSIRHPTYFGRVSFALSQEHVPNALDDDDTGSGPSNPLKIPVCTDECDLCSGKVPVDPRYPFHWQSDFTHVICCVIPCVSPFTPYGLAPYTGLNDGTMDLALSLFFFIFDFVLIVFGLKAQIPKVSRFKNMQIMRKVAMYGARFIRSEYPDVKVFRVCRWKFTPKSLVLNPGEGETVREDESVAMYGARFIRSEYPDVKVFRVCRWKFTPKSLVLNPGEGETVREDESGAWNLDGEILPQPPNKSLTFRLHPRLINYFGRDSEVDLNDPSYSRCCPCFQCESSKVSRLIG